jgi:hypothetical protein
VYKLLYTKLEGTRAGGIRAFAKFMLSVRKESFEIISAEARNRGVSVQELLRAVIVPEWIRNNTGSLVPAQTLRGVASAQQYPFLKVSALRPRS